MLRQTKLAGAALALIMLGLGLVGAAAGPAAAATSCVSKTKSGCISTINAAIASANPGDIINVYPGTYNEDVVIGKSLFLVGSNSGNTVINAHGQANGIYIDGFDNPGLNHVSVSGFTVENANFEGILVTSASQITIQDNKVTGNDRNLNFSGPSCPGLPSFETGETFDCGEGVHFIGVDHSSIVNNTIVNNAGGILLSDETYETHDNLVSGNDVENNAYDCGITLASHPQYPSGSPLGVNRNSILGNTSNHNGNKGDGAGVGIFAGAVGGAVEQNVIANNQLTNNGLPGIAFHAHAPGEFLNDNVIVGNLISGNAADTDDAATSGPTGINIYGASPITGTIIARNEIKGEDLDIVTHTSGTVDIHLNNLLPSGKLTVGVDNTGGGAVDASENYWGCAGGPGSPKCSMAQGAVTVFPVLTAKAP